MPDIKPGNHVRVVRNVVNAHKIHDWYIPLEPGDVVTVYEIKEGKVFYQMDIGGTNYIPVEDVELVDECICDIIKLMSIGCTCGAFARENS